MWLWRITVPLLLIMVSIENVFAAGAAVLAGRQLGAKDTEGGRAHGYHRYRPVGNHRYTAVRGRHCMYRPVDAGIRRFLGHHNIPVYHILYTDMVLRQRPFHY